MNEQTVIEIGVKTVWLAVQIASPALVAALVMGLIVSILQAATQINEQTLSFIPKILAMLAAMIVCGPWIITKIVGFTVSVFRDISTISQ